MLSIQPSGYHLYYMYSRWNLGATMMTRLRNGSTRNRQRVFEVYPVSQKDRTKWMHEKEFSYQDEMYDVVGRSVEGNRIILHCVSDHEENQLVAQYEKITKNDFGRKQSGKSRQLLQLAASLYIQQALIIDFSIARQEPLHHAGPCSCLPDCTRRVLTPPPRRA